MLHRLLIALSLVSCVAHAQSDTITLEDIWTKGTFRPRSVPGFTALRDGKRYSAVASDSLSRIWNYDLATGKQLSLLFEGKMPGGEAVEDYAFSADEKRLLLFSESQNIYRRSVLHRVAVYDVATRRFLAVDSGKVLHAAFSPDGTKVAFVKANNLYYRDLDRSQTVAVTTDGERNRIINGNCDWVYEEEFEFTQAYQWSPDSRSLAYYRFDESAVSEAVIPRYDTGAYPWEYRYKYPKAGAPNSAVTIHIYNLARQRAVPVGGEAAEYTPRIQWTADPSKLCVLRMNRWQNTLTYLLADAATGATTELLTEEDPAYVEVNDNRAFLPDGRSMLYTSERGGWNELWRWDWKRQRHTRLSPAGMDIEAIAAIDSVRGLVYFTAAPKTVDRQLYAVRTDGKGLRRITREPGTHAVTAAGSSFFLDAFSSLGQPASYRLLDADGRVLRTLEDNAALKATMAKYRLGRIRLLQLEGAALAEKLANGKARTTALNAWMITPPGFDSTHKYPVLMFQYSGPGSQQVADRFPTGDFFWHQMLAQKGYIVVCADGTGTGFRGAAFKKRTYLQLGRYESDDQIAVANSLAKLPYVDKSRIGIWGWSFGGFMSSTCLFKAPEVFKMGISVAPVTNWRYYDNIYTERYLRRPQDNPAGYDDNAPVSRAKDLQGAFLLVHGTADDNVHFQNSVMLVNELIRRGKAYDSEYYPNKAHGIGGAGTRLHLYRRMTNFILDHL